MKYLRKIKDLVKKCWLATVSFFFPRYKIIVSYNKTWGDLDDREFIVKKFYKKQPKFLKFKTHDGEMIEIRGAEGLNYRIEEL
tara:strand:- start:14 stop:262 length:249 start_codon:yes stop_codon:yes gene_type:complete